MTARMQTTETIVAIIVCPAKNDKRGELEIRQIWKRGPSRNQTPCTHFQVCIGLLADGRVRSDHVERESEARSLAQGVSYDIV